MVRGTDINQYSQQQVSANPLFKTTNNRKNDVVCEINNNDNVHYCNDFNLEDNLIYCFMANFVEEHIFQSGNCITKPLCFHNVIV